MKTGIMILLLMTSQILFAQKNVTLNDISFELSDQAKTETYKNHECLNIDGGTAKVLNLEFENGIIEYDICVQQIRGFAGVRFRANKNNSEEFYIRMHQSGNPDAMQYTPVYNGNAGWQLYHGDGYSAVKDYPFDEWFHIKLAVNGSRGEVYIEDMDKPVLVIHELKIKNAKGSVVFYGPARFSNIRISKTEPKLKGAFNEVEQAGNNVIKTYLVSEPFNIESQIKSAKLDDEFVKSLEFVTLQTEANGLANLSCVTKLSKEKNAVLVQYKINSASDQVKVMNFGFSDAAKVYVNGTAVWMGMDSFRSRDYRFLGTIGYFDSVFMPLRKGENTISMIIFENFGGWGFKAKVDQMDGISYSY